MGDRRRAIRHRRSGPGIPRLVRVNDPYTMYLTRTGRKHRVVKRTLAVSRDRSIKHGNSCPETFALRCLYYSPVHAPILTILLLFEIVQ